MAKEPEVNKVWTGASR